MERGPGAGGTAADSAAGKTRVLFLCTGNSCRSQMAEGLARHLGGERIESLSAGVMAAGVNPIAEEVMREIGIDISDQWSKDVSEVEGLDPDIVITLCGYAQSQCPAFAGARVKVHWPTDDPSQTYGTREELLPRFRATRDELAAKIRAFLDQLPSGVR